MGADIRLDRKDLLAFQSSSSSSPSSPTKGGIPIQPRATPQALELEEPSLAHDSTDQPAPGAAKVSAEMASDTAKGASTQPATGAATEAATGAAASIKSDSVPPSLKPSSAADQVSVDIGIQPPGETAKETGIEVETISRPAEARVVETPLAESLPDEAPPDVEMASEEASVIEAAPTHDQPIETRPDEAPLGEAGAVASGDVSEPIKPDSMPTTPAEIAIGREVATEPAAATAVSVELLIAETEPASMPTAQTSSAAPPAPIVETATATAELAAIGTTPTQVGPTAELGTVGVAPAVTTIAGAEPAVPKTAAALFNVASATQGAPGDDVMSSAMPTVARPDFSAAQDMLELAAVVDTPSPRSQEQLAGGSSPEVVQEPMQAPVGVHDNVAESQTVQEVTGTSQQVIERRLRELRTAVVNDYNELFEVLSHATVETVKEYLAIDQHEGEARLVDLAAVVHKLVASTTYDGSVLESTRAMRLERAVQLSRQRMLAKDNAYKSEKEDWSKERQEQRTAIEGLERQLAETAKERRADQQRFESELKSVKDECAVLKRDIADKVVEAKHAREEFNKLQDLLGNIQTEFHDQVDGLKQTIRTLNESLNAAEQDKADMAKLILRPPTYTDLQEGKVRSEAVVVYKEKSFVVVANGDRGYKFWSVDEDIPGARLGNHACSGDAWGAFRTTDNEEEETGEEPPLYVCMEQSKVAELETMAIELEKRRVLEEQNAFENSHSMTYQVVLREDERRIHQLEEEIAKLNHLLSEQTQNTRPPDSNAPTEADPEPVGEVELADLRRKLQRAEKCVRDGQRRIGLLESELLEASKKMSKFMTPPEIIMPLEHSPQPLETDMDMVSESAAPQSMGIHLSTERRLAALTDKNDELEKQVKSLKTQLASNMDEYHMLQLKQSIVYLLGLIPENQNKELELTIQTVIGLMELGNEDRDRLSIKRGPPSSLLQNIAARWQ